MNNNVVIKSGNFIKEWIIIKQFLKYSIVGVFNTLIRLGTIFILHNIYNVNYIWANVFGYVLGLINSFTWNKRWTLRSQKHYSKEINPFLIIFIISYAANLIMVVASVQLFRIDTNVAQIIGICAYLITNFFLIENGLSCIQNDQFPKSLLIKNNRIMENNDQFRSKKVPVADGVGFTDSVLTIKLVRLGANVNLIGSLISGMREKVSFQSINLNY